MTQFLETVCNISFDQPGDSSPMVVDFSQRRVTSTIGARIPASGWRTAAQSTLPAESVSLLAPACQTRRACRAHVSSRFSSECRFVVLEAIDSAHSVMLL